MIPSVAPRREIGQRGGCAPSVPIWRVNWPLKPNCPLFGDAEKPLNRCFRYPTRLPM